LIREEKYSNFEHKNKVLEQKIKHPKKTNAIEIERIVYSKVEEYMKMVESNDVFE